MKPRTKDGCAVAQALFQVLGGVSPTILQWQVEAWRVLYACTSTLLLPVLIESKRKYSALVTASYQLHMNTQARHRCAHLREHGAIGHGRLLHLALGRCMYSNDDVRSGVSSECRQRQPGQAMGHTGRVKRGCDDCFELYFKLTSTVFGFTAFKHRGGANRH
jgi:hypothetical protein